MLITILYPMSKISLIKEKFTRVLDDRGIEWKENCPTSFGVGKFIVDCGMDDPDSCILRKPFDLAKFVKIKFSVFVCLADIWEKN